MRRNENYYVIGLMKIPEEVKFVVSELEKRGFEAYIVGGCVRDFLRGEEPGDWDAATNAPPEEIGKIFLRSYANNKFGTVTAQIEKEIARGKKPAEEGGEQEKAPVMEIEITPYRIESKYTDKRHPDEVKWAKNIKEDLSRRDFTVNAMALSLRRNNSYAIKQMIGGTQFAIIDLFGGREDLNNKIIRAVGNPDERFKEDALRLMRAVRFAATLNGGWKIEEKTAEAIKNNAGLLRFISKERVRDEFSKIVMGKGAVDGIERLRELGLLKYIIPELLESYKVGQNKHHIYDVYKHSLLSLKYACEENFSKEVRFASLFHDIGKPRVKRGEGLNSTFYSHEIVGAEMTAKILTRLKFSKKEIEKITRLVRYHLFYYNSDEVGESSVRRLVRKAGMENVEELLQLRKADRIGSGVPKAEPYKLRHLKYVIEKISQDPISVKTLKVNGTDVMGILNLIPGPKIGQILDILLGYVLEDPAKNKKDYLEKEIKKLGKLSDKNLSDLAEKARQEREKIETKRDEMTKQKYWVT